MTQGRLDYEAGQRAKKAGMERAAKGVTPEFRRSFMAAARLAAYLSDAAIYSRLPDVSGFTSDDIVMVLKAWEIPLPSEGRALGPLMQEMVRRGIASPTTEYRPSRLASCHGTPRRVYRRKTT